MESKLKDPDRSVRLEAAKVLSQHNPDHVGIVPTIVERLLQGESIGPTDFSCLDRIMEKAAPMLQQALRSGDAKTRVAIICSLGWSKTQAAFSTVAEMLDDPAPEIRAQAASSLWHFVDTQDILPHLLKAARDTDQQVRHQARWALRMSGLAKKALPDLIRALAGIGAPGVPVLVAALRNTVRLEVEVRSFAATMLAGFGQADPAVISVLAESLRDADPGVRDSAARALSKIGPAAQIATSRLVELLNDECDIVRETAGHALSAIATTESRPEAALTGAC